MRHVSKQASRRTYKDNVSGMKLGCKVIKKRRLGPDNQNQIIRIEHPGLDSAPLVLRWPTKQAGTQRALHYWQHVVEAARTPG